MKKIIALSLCLVLALTLAPSAAFAADDPAMLSENDPAADTDTETGSDSADNNEDGEPAAQSGDIYGDTQAGALTGEEDDGHIIHRNGYSYSLSGASVSIGESYSVNFLVDTDDPGAYMQYYVDGSSTPEPYTGWTLGGISPRQMTVGFDAALYSHDGVKQLYYENFSICTYIDMLYREVSESSDEYGMALKELLASMLKLGEYSQIYTNYRLDDLASDGRDWVDMYYMQTDAPAAPATGSEGPRSLARVTSVGISVSDHLKLFFALQVPADAEIELESSMDGSNYALVVRDTPENLLLADQSGPYLVNKNSQYMFMTNGFDATQNSIMFRLTLFAGGDMQHSVTYGPLKYIATNWNSADKTVADMVRGLYIYGRAAEKFAALSH